MSDEESKVPTILRLVEHWSGGPEQALDWYRTEPIPAFGSRTAEAVVEAGGAEAVREYIEHLAAGGYQ